MTRVDMSEQHLKHSSLRSARKPSLRCGATARKQGRKNWRRMVRAARPLGLVVFGIILGACGAGHPGFSASHAAMLNPTDGPKISASTVQLISKPVGVPSREMGVNHGRWIIVQPGDTVWILAERYGDPDQPVSDSVENILHCNGLNENARLQPGQRIWIRH